MQINKSFGLKTMLSMNQFNLLDTNSQLKH